MSKGDLMDVTSEKIKKTYPSALKEKQSKRSIWNNIYYVIDDNGW